MEKARRAAHKRTVLANNTAQAAALQSMLHPNKTSRMRACSGWKSSVGTRCDSSKGAA